jgi:hypothetical protein
LVVTRPKSLAFGATPGFGGDLKFSFGFGGDKKLSLLVATQKDPHLVVTRTNTSKMAVTKSRPRIFRGFGGDSTQAPSFFAVLVVKAPTFSGDCGDSSEF